MGRLRKEVAGNLCARGRIYDERKEEGKKERVQGTLQVNPRSGPGCLLYLLHRRKEREKERKNERRKERKNERKEDRKKERLKEKEKGDMDRQISSEEFRVLGIRGMAGYGMVWHGRAGYVLMTWTGLTGPDRTRPDHCTRAACTGIKGMEWNGMEGKKKFLPPSLGVE